MEMLKLIDNEYTLEAIGIDIIGHRLHSLNAIKQLKMLAASSNDNNNNNNKVIGEEIFRIDDVTEVVMDDIIGSNVNDSNC